MTVTIVTPFVPDTLDIDVARLRRNPEYLAGIGCYGPPSCH